MLILLLGIVDLARIYTTMLSVASAAREAADYGTTLGAGKWQSPTPADTTVAEMERRSCVASSNLTGSSGRMGTRPWAGARTPRSGACVRTSMGGPCGALDPAAGCEDPLRAPPCIVTVTLHYGLPPTRPAQLPVHGREGADSLDESLRSTGMAASR